MDIKQIMLASCLFATTISSPVFANNFSYTYVGISLGKATLDEQISFDGEIYKELGVASLSGGYQFAQNFAVSVASSAASNNGHRTELTESSVVVTALFPFAVSPAMDIVPHVGRVSLEAEACIDGWCYKVDDSGLVYGIGIRAWLIPSQLELAVNYTDNDIDELDSVVSLSGGLWFQERHRINLSHSIGSDSKSTVVGYSYNW